MIILGGLTLLTGIFIALFLKDYKKRKEDNQITKRFIKSWSIYFAVVAILWGILGIANFKKFVGKDKAPIELKK